jgi:glycosyltransferase involved in cell wall biosynthesis
MEKEQEQPEGGLTHLLSLVWYQVLPARFGGQKGIAQFNEHLARHFRLSCLCSSDNTPSGKEGYAVFPELPVGRRQVLFPWNWKRIFDKAGALGVTHIILEHAYYGIPAIMLKSSGLPLVAHSHNLEYERFRALGRWWWPLLRILERRVHRSADLSLFKTEADRSAAIQEFGLSPERCMVLPYGLEREGLPDVAEKRSASEKIRTRYGLADDEKILYFNGTLDYEPNAEALRFLVNELLPELDKVTGFHYRLLVTGRNQRARFRDLKGLRHERYLPLGMLDEVDELFLAADLFLNPVKSGGGIKVKTMEALSWGLPVVSTAHAAAGIDLKQTGTRLRITGSDDPAAFAQAILKALDDRSAIPDTFFDTYRWEAVIAPLVARLASLR